MCLIAPELAMRESDLAIEEIDWLTLDQRIVDSAATRLEGSKIKVNLEYLSSSLEEVRMLSRMTNY